jgi:hypothetical protein
VLISAKIGFAMVEEFAAKVALGQTYAPTPESGATTHVNWKLRHMLKDTASPPPSLSDEAKDYLKEEQKQRRQQIENLIASIESDQKNGLIFTGAIWSWLATHIGTCDGNFAKVIVILPPLIMSFFLYRREHIDREIFAIAEYTREVEKLFGVPDKYGCLHGGERKS